MKICLFLNDLRGGGAERVACDLAFEFLEAGHEVEFLLLNARGELLDEVRNKFKIFNLSMSRIRTSITPVVRYLDHCRPDVILAAVWPLTVVAPIAVWLSRQSIVVIVSEHNTLSIQYGSLGLMHKLAMRLSMALGYRLATKRVGVSLGVAKDISNLSGLKKDAFTVIHNPVAPPTDIAKSLYATVDAMWKVASGARIVAVGSMKRQKNHRLMLLAFAKLARNDSQLMFVGDGPERESLAALALELDISDRVVFAGFQSDPTPFYKTADLFVLSSDYEGFGNVIVEALACGTPVVSTDCPSGPAEILDGGRFGRLVPVGDVEALASAMSIALDELADRDALKHRAADFLPQIAARKYLELMDL